MREEKKPTNWRAWGIGALIALALIICLQNSQQVSVEVLTAEFSAPLIVILLVAIGVGAVIGYAFPVLRRHRREERKRDAQDKLKG